MVLVSVGYIWFCFCSVLPDHLPAFALVHLCICVHLCSATACISYRSSSYLSDSVLCICLNLHLSVRIYCLNYMSASVCLNILISTCYRWFQRLHHHLVFALTSASALASIADVFWLPGYTSAL
ncbi:hypothetical protein Tco_0645383 [Tanacetum coccineum]